MPIYARLLVTLVAIVVIAWWWWQDDSPHPASPVIESTTPTPLAEPEPTQPADLQVNPSAQHKKSNIDTDQSTATPEGVTVRGRVSNKLGQGIGGLQIEIRPVDRSAWHQNVYTASTDQQGEYRFDAIPVDIEYRLEVLAAGGHSGTQLGHIAVERDMLPVMIILDSIELVTVDGMIVDADDAPVADFAFLVQNIDIAYPGREVVSDSSGFFRLDQFPAGELQLSTSGAEHFKITGIRLQPGDYRNLRIVLDKGGYHLSGWVSDEFDAPIGQARISLTSEFAREDYRSSSFRLDIADANGGFRFSNLGWQVHRITVDAIGYETQVLDYHFQSFSDDLKIQMHRKQASEGG